MRRRYENTSRQDGGIYIFWKYLPIYIHLYKDIELALWSAPDCAVRMVFGSHFKALRITIRDGGSLLYTIKKGEI